MGLCRSFLVHLTLAGAVEITAQQYGVNWLFVPWYENRKLILWVFGIIGSLDYLGRDLALHFLTDVKLNCRPFQFRAQSISMMLGRNASFKLAQVRREFGGYLAGDFAPSSPFRSLEAATRREL